MKVNNMIDQHPQVLTQPFAPNVLIKIMLAVIIVLALFAGYYESRFYLWRESHLRVLDKLNVKSAKEVLQSNWERK